MSQLFLKFCYQIHTFNLKFKDTRLFLQLTLKQKNTENVKKN